jgi:hypothetical protein
VVLGRQRVNQMLSEPFVPGFTEVGSQARGFILAQEGGVQEHSLLLKVR